MLGTTYTRYGLLCEGISSQNFEREYAMCEYLLDDRAYHDTNIQLSFVVLWVSISCYFGILNDGFGHPQERCQWYSLYVRLAFVVV